MLSIEVGGIQARIEDNKPFNIRVDYRHSNLALPEHNWQERTVAWLDYDDPLSTDILHDINTIAARACSGSLLAVTVQCSQAPEVKHAQEEETKAAAAAAGGEPVNTVLSPVERFFTNFGSNRVPKSTNLENLYGWAYGTLSRSIIVREIEAALAVRNSLDSIPLMEFQPICEFEYEDGAKMTTLVGVFFSPAERSLLRDCHFEGLDFLNSSGKPVRIKVPKLTAKEFRKLESQLPLAANQAFSLGTIPAREAKNFEYMYRYLPNFGVLEG